MPKDNERDLHHSQGVEVASVLSGVDPEELRDTQPAALRVDNIMPKLEQLLSERTRQVFANERRGMSPELFTLGRVYQNAELTQEDLVDYANRLNQMTAKLNGTEFYQIGPDPLFGYRPKLDAAMAPPLAIPLINQRVHAVSYVFIYDLPGWKFKESLDALDAFDPDVARAWLNDHFSSWFSFVREGELP